MSSDNETNTENTRLWRIALQLAPQALSVVQTSTVADASLRRFTLPLDPSQTSLRALEEAVYSMPELLGDFDRTDIIVRTGSYIVVPGELSDDDALSAAAYAQLDNSDDPSTLVIDRTDSATVVWSIDSDIRNFLARTFRNVPVQCHVSPLLRYLRRRSESGNTAKLYAHLTGDSIDIIIFSADNRLLLAVTHTAETDTDALYFIMATARHAGLDLTSDEILLFGDAARRMSLMPLVSRYAARVMPLIFPSAALRAGREAFKAPFPLILLPLCE